MVPDTNSPDDPGFDEAVLYRVVRDAVEDAILGAVGTIMLTGVGLVVVWIGLGFAAAAGSANLLWAAVGILVALFGLYLAAASLRVVPPASTWL